MQLFSGRWKKAEFRIMDGNAAKRIVKIIAKL